MVRTKGVQTVAQDDCLLLRRRRFEPVDHGDNGAQLSSAAVVPTSAGVAPPVPASHWVVAEKSIGALNLWIQHDQAIRLRPSVVPSVLDKRQADVRGRLFTTVQRDMEAASGRFGRGAACRHIDVAAVGHPRTPFTREERPLVEGDDRLRWSGAMRL